MKNDLTGGVYIERKLYLSDAYLYLSKNGRMVLLAFLDVRQRNPGFKKAVKKGFRAERFVGLDKIKMPYTKLRDYYGIPVGSIPRALDELLAHGFIEIKHQGGAGEHDQSIYALVDDYLRWAKGKVFRRRTKDVHRGYQGKGLGVVAPKCPKCGSAVDDVSTWAGCCSGSCFGENNQSSHARNESYTHAKSESYYTQNENL